MTVTDNRNLLRSCARDRQRGAIGVFGVLVFLLAVLFTAVAIDTARLTLDKRRLQNIADLAALQAMKVAGLCSGVESIDLDAVKATAQTSAAADGYAGNLGTEAGAVLLGTATADANGVRQFTSTAAADADAVQVTATATVLKSIVAGGWFAGNTQLTAVAVARRHPWGDLKLGSFLAGVNSADVVVLNQLFGGLLGSNVNLQLASYQGLAAAQVTIGDLVRGANISAGNVQDFLDTRVTIAGLITIILNGLDTSSAAYQALNQLLPLAGANSNTLRIGDLIQVTTSDPNAVAAASVNIAALLSGGIQLANQHRAISIPVTVSLPAGMSNATLSLYLVEPPVTAAGEPGKDSTGTWRTQARTAQLRFAVNVAMNAPVGPVTVVGSFGIFGSAASASGALATMQCGSMADLSNVVTIEVVTGIAQLGVGGYADIADGTVINPNPALTVQSLGVDVATIDIAATLQAASTQAQQTIFNVDAAHPLPQTATVGTDAAAALNTAAQSLADSLRLSVTVLPLTAGLPLGYDSAALTQDVNQTLLQPTLGALKTGLLAPLLNALGVRFGGADVELVDINREDTAQLML